MQEQLIEWEVAVMAKRKGFDLPSHAYFKYKNMVVEEYQDTYLNIYSILPNVQDGKVDIECFLRPTQSLLQKWLREVHSIHVHCFTYAFGWYVKHDNTPNPESWNIDKRWDSYNPKEAIGDYFKTYEEALEYGLNKALERIKI